MSINREVLAKYIKPGDCIFLETGARWGDTCIRAIECGAVIANSCESDPLMAKIAQLHTDDATRGTGIIGVIESDSVEFLSDASRSWPWQNNDKTIVFLDAHTDRKSPVLQEIEAIGLWKSLPKVIMIDDLRCFQDWGIDKGDLYQRLISMGYKLSFESGVAPEDILVAQR